MKTVLALLLLLGLPILSWAGLPVDFQSISASSVNTVVTIALDATQNKCYTLTLCNDGTKTAYYNLNGTVATTNNVPDGSGIQILTLECHKWGGVASSGNFPVQQLGIITSGADTTTVRVFCSPLK